MATATKLFKFDAGHRLMHHGGKCSNLHGHEYKLEISLKGEVDDTSGFVIDFSIIKKIVSPLIDYFDHAMVLNENDVEVINLCKKNSWKMFILPNEPTAENIGLYFKKVVDKSLFDKGYKLEPCTVKIWETSGSYAEL